jgi:hypothetical protein
MAAKKRGRKQASASERAEPFPTAETSDQGSWAKRRIIADAGRRRCLGEGTRPTGAARGRTARHRRGTTRDLVRAMRKSGVRGDGRRCARKLQRFFAPR